MATTTFVLYRYDPSLVAAVVFILLFLAAGCCHVYQLLRSKTWYMVPFCIGIGCKYSY
jgi:hypothetical protein